MKHVEYKNHTMFYITDVKRQHFIAYKSISQSPIAVDMNLKRICFWKDNIDVLYALVGATLYIDTLGRKLTNLISVNSVN